jgi:hypothetical protein
MEQEPRIEQRHHTLLRAFLSAVLTLINSQFWLLESFLVGWIWIQAVVTLWPTELFTISLTYQVMAVIMPEAAWGLVHLFVASFHLTGYLLRHRYPAVRSYALNLMAMWCAMMTVVNIAPGLIAPAPFIYGWMTIHSALIVWRYSNELGRQRAR